ncbi:hypothetical protein GCM10027421_20690 [Microbacterium shaanxiense]
MNACEHCRVAAEIDDAPQHGRRQLRCVDELQVHVVVRETTDDESSVDAPHHAPISVRTV